MQTAFEVVSHFLNFIQLLGVDMKDDQATVNTLTTFWSFMTSKISPWMSARITGYSAVILDKFVYRLTDPRWNSQSRWLVFLYSIPKALAISSVFPFLSARAVPILLTSFIRLSIRMFSSSDIFEQYLLDPFSEMQVISGMERLFLCSRYPR